MFYCPYCNLAIRDEDYKQECPRCGTPLHSIDAPNAEPEHKRTAWPADEIYFGGKSYRERTKRAAKDRLSGSWWKAFAVILISILLLCLIAVPTLGFGVLLLFGPLSLGQAAFFQQLHREGRAQLRTMLPSLTNFVKGLWLGLIQLPVPLLCILRLHLILLSKLVYSYSMSWYILNDHPELTPREALSASQELLQGNMGELFLLDLSFIGGWIPSLAFFFFGLQEPILQLGTLLLLSLTLLYQSAARAAFYEDLKALQTQNQQAAA